MRRKKEAKQEKLPVRTIRFILLAACSAFVLCSCIDKEAPETIVIGQVTSLTGPQAEGVQSTTGPIHEMWIEEINKKGGLYIKDYDKKIPVEYLKYDDESDIDKMKSLLKKMMLEDKVHFVLPPWSTTFHYEAALLTNQYGYILVGGAGSAIKLKEIISGLPYFFSVLNHADTQMPAFADILEETGVKRVGILFVDVLFGIEYTATIVPELGLRDIDVVMLRDYHYLDPDIATVLADTMSEAMDLEVDAFLGFTYPDASFPAPGVAMELGFNPKVFSLAVGPSYAAFRDAYGNEAVEGIIGPGAWNTKTSKEAKVFAEKFIKRWDQEPEYWGHLSYYSSLQFFEQAIEKAGTLDQAEIREIMSTSTFDTAMGPMKFENGINVASTGDMGQWQDGIFEVIGPDDKRTADTLFPKPEWPIPVEE
jgi:branched-chain amino acid transport system substrate-binding protein